MSSKTDDLPEGSEPQQACAAPDANTAPTAAAPLARLVTVGGKPVAPAEPPLGQLGHAPSRIVLPPPPLPFASPVHSSPTVTDARNATQPHHPRAGHRSLNRVLVLLALPVIVLALWPSLTPKMLDPSARSAPSALAQLTGPDGVTRMLAVGNLSPSGVDATNLTAKEVLLRAERAIFGRGGQANVAERRFWLRKSIAKLLAEPQSRWAATQLGAMQTAPAGPGRKPDYDAAKTLWEIASASGDVVATCFVAQLYELGLGVDTNSERAKQWYRRANEMGGCNLRREPPGPALTN